MPGSIEQPETAVKALTKKTTFAEGTASSSAQSCIAVEDAEISETSGMQSLASPRYSAFAANKYKDITDELQSILADSKSLRAQIHQLSVKCVRSEGLQKIVLPALNSAWNDAHTSYIC